MDKNEGIFYIVAAGERTNLNFVPTSKDFVVAVDGGFDYLAETNRKADLVIGDMDSIRKFPAHNNVIRLKKEKDDTDTLAAIKIGIEKGYQVFHIYCGTGGRLSHTFANIQCLDFLAQKGLRGYLCSNDQILTVIHNEEIIIDQPDNPLISVFSLSPQTLVTLNGLKYCGENIALQSSYPLGVSNEFICSSAKIKAGGGSLLIVYNEKS